jgi:hypothetical protein
LKRDSPHFRRHRALRGPIACHEHFAIVRTALMRQIEIRQD